MKEYIKKPEHPVLAIGGSAAAAIFVFIPLLLLTKGGVLPALASLRQLSTLVKSLLLIIVLAAGIFLALSLTEKSRNALFTHRYHLAVILFLLCVIFGLNGSSADMWHIYMESGESANLAGTARLYRTDEWALFTPMSLSQYTNSNGAFTQMNPVFRGTDTDMLLVYGQPVWDIATIFRPFFWGYLLLPKSQGIAWFWCGRLLMLLMTSFEFGRLLTDDKRGYAVCYALLVSFSPWVQWWFSINGLVEMLIACQFSVLLFEKYLRTDNHVLRGLYTGLILLSAGSFLMAFYPAWMVPIAYIILGLILWVTFKNRQKIVRIKAVDIGTSAILLILFSLILWHIWVVSGDSIKLMLNTAYPGKRAVLCGGGAEPYVSRYIDSLWYSFNTSAIRSEEALCVCDRAQMLCFWPFPEVLALWVMIRQKKADPGVVILLFLSLFFLAFILLPLPASLFLSMVGTARLTCVLSFLEVILLFRIIGFVSRPFRLPSMACIILPTLIGAFIYNHKFCDSFISPLFYIITFVAFSGFLFLFLLALQHKKAMFWLLSVTLGLTYFSGFLVNPIRRGIDDVQETALVQTIRNINETESGLWAVISGYPYNNIPVLADAACLNSTNIYPNLELWKRLDPEEENEAVYNRYAHICLKLKEVGEPEFRLIQDDYFELTLTEEDLSSLGVSYVLTISGEDGLLDQKYTPIAEYGSFSVYRLP